MAFKKKTELHAHKIRWAEAVTDEVLAFELAQCRTRLAKLEAGEVDGAKPGGWRSKMNEDSIWVIEREQAKRIAQKRA